jgi:hypothetical protein
MGVGREAGKVISMKTVADDTSGSTAIIALVTPTHVLSANLGDSRMILVSRGGEGLVATVRTLLLPFTMSTSRCRRTVRISPPLGRACDAR